MITIRVDNSVKVNGDYALFVSFPYDNKILQVVRSFPTRVWNTDSKEWEIPFNKLGALIKQLSDYDIQITGKYVSLEKPKVKYPINFNFKTQPYGHQVEGFNFGLRYNRWLLGDEQGLGKTKQVIDIAVAKKSQAGFKHCLIVCGVNGLKWNWMSEIKTHSNEEGWILGQRWYAKKRRWKIGSSKEKYEDVANLENIKQYFIITNVETLRNDKIATKLAELCKSGDIAMVAIDEIHKCKNPSSQQGKGILKLESEYRIALTGTPLMNHPLDLYIILKWLGYEKHAYYKFKTHYCVFGGFGGKEVVGYRNLSELREQLEEVMLRRRKEEVLDLPEKVYINEYVEMGAKQTQIYNEITNEIRANIDQIKFANNPLAELIRMRQATGFTGILSSSIQESAKLDRMEELVEEAIADEKKVVIFSNWTQMTDVIQERLSQYNPLVITGQTNDAHRQLCVETFQNNPNYKVIVGTVGAMGTGLTLTAGTVEIFVDEPWNKANKEQAEDRCHRIGASSTVTIYTLLTKDTIDERIHELVERKGAMSDALVDGKIAGNTMETLEFLLS